MSNGDVPSLTRPGTVGGLHDSRTRSGQAPGFPEAVDLQAGAATGTAAGLWIDHRKAVIVSMTAHGDTTRIIVSRVEKQLGRFAGLRSTTPYEAQLVPADKRQEQRFHGHLAVYYDAVVAAIRGADAILVFGPGEAKTELRQRLAKTGRSGQIVEFETFDKMTDRESPRRCGSTSRTRSRRPTRRSRRDVDGSARGH